MGLWERFAFNTPLPKYKNFYTPLLTMKRNWIFVSLIGLFALNATAQTLAPTQGALVYYMPQTVLVLDLTVTQTTTQRGVFYQYAERYLGTRDIVLKDETTYRLQDIQLHTRTQADTARVYTVPFDPKTPALSLLTLTSKGILQGFNLPASPTVAPQKPVLPEPKHKSKKHSSLAVPLSEEALMANSLAKMAADAAQQIYRLREARVALLEGNVDHTPADGQAMQLTLQTLDEQEAQLTELFIGHTKKQTRHQTVTYLPTQSVQKQVLFRFSTFNGLVDKNDMSGEPYFLTLNAHFQPLDSEPKGKAKDLSPIYYNLPGSADLSLCNTEAVVITKSLPIAQFGVSVRLPLSLLNENTSIEFFPKTGAVKAITRLSNPNEPAL